MKISTLNVKKAQNIYDDEFFLRVENWKKNNISSNKYRR